METHRNVVTSEAHIGRLPDDLCAPRRGLREALAVVAVASALVVAVTYPFAFQLTHVGRIDNSDGQFSIWNVAWVARTVVMDPRHVFDANIFYPHRWTLAYSENNLGAGILAVPAYWTTRNPYFAHNFVVLLAFVLSACGMYYLVRYLVADRRAAGVSAICFAFCPYVLAHTSHIQLLMTAGLPFSMLAFHRLIDCPGGGRAVALGAAMAAQAICCGYYGVFVMLMIGLSALTIAARRNTWRTPRYWAVLALAALAAVALATPVAVPYLVLKRLTGFARPLTEAAQFSANWSAYLASNGLGHRWLLPYIGHWNEVLFPGFVAMVCSVTGTIVGWRKGGHVRETVILYGTLAVLALWASFGPNGRLYTMLYAMIPIFTWLRAPARFGVLVAFALSVLSGIAVQAMLDRRPHATVSGIVLALVATMELAVPLHFRQVSPVSPAYRMLQRLPSGPVIELPFFKRRSDWHGHATYMLNSTTHWMPLINGYSDYVPQDFAEAVDALYLFPSREALRRLEGRCPRYAVFHMKAYQRGDRDELLNRVHRFSSSLRVLYLDDDVRLYEIVGCSLP